MAPRESEDLQTPPSPGGILSGQPQSGADAGLRRERDLLASLAETSPVGIAVVDRDGQITFANPRAEQILGLTKSEITQRRYDAPGWRITRYDGSALPEDELPFRRVRSAGAPVLDIGHAIEWPDGRRVLLSINAAPLFDASGGFDGMVATLEDVTARERAEEARRSSEEKFRTLFDSANDALFLMDGQVFIDVNARCVEIFGLADRSDIVGRTPWDFSPAAQPDGRDSAEKALEYIGAALRGIPQRFYWKHCRKDGVPFDAEVSLNAFSLHGKAYLQAAVTNTSERTAAEEALRESEERYRDFFENAIDVVFTVDLEGNLLTLNRAGETASGYSRAELVGRNLFSIIEPESAERAREAMRRKLAGETDRTSYEVELDRKGSRARVTLDVSTRLVYRDGVPVGMQGIARDVTQRQRLEAELQQAQKMEGIGRLAGGIAHDFNNLLTAILGQAELARLALDDGDQPRRELDQILESARRAAALTRQLLAFARKELIRPQVISLNELVLDVDKLLRRLIGEHIALLTIPAPGLGAVRVDPGQMEQVLVNLAVNARDAMPSGGKLTVETANVTLDERSARQHPEVVAGPYVMLAVSDTGSGMTKDVLAHVFEPFFTTKGPGEGTGLGLATCYGIVRQNGGHIAVYSEPGRGTTFRIYLPRVTEPSGRIASNRAAPEALVEGRETIMLAEDDALVRNLAASTLRRAGYTVLEATSGHDALAREREHAGAIDLLLTDLVMPHMGGRELADRMLAIRPGIKVLFTSGYAETGIAHRGELDAAVSFLPKPFDPAGLARKVRAVLDGLGLE